MRRGVIPGVVGPIEVTDIETLSDLNDWGLFDHDDIAGAQAFLEGLVVDQGFVEDLANLNLSYGMDIGAGDPRFDQFTLRVNLATVPLLVARLGALTALRRSRRV